MSKIYIIFCVVVMSCISVFSKNEKLLNQVIHKDTISYTKEIVQKLTASQQKYYRLGNYELFKTYTDSILEFAQSNNLKETEIEAMVSLSIYFEKNASNDFNKKMKLEYLQRALDTVKILPDDPERKIAILIRMGNLYYNAPLSYATNDPLSEARKLLGKHPEISDTYEMAIDFGQGLYYSQRANLEVALSALERAKNKAITSENSYVHIASLNTMIDIYNRLGQPEKAFKYCKEAIKRCKTNEYSQLWTISIFLSGYTLNNLKKHLGAAQMLELALKIAKANGYSEVENYTHKLLSEVYRELGDFQKSDKHLKLYKPSETRLHFFPYSIGLNKTIKKETYEAGNMKPKTILAMYTEAEILCIETPLYRKPLIDHINDKIAWILISLLILSLLIFYIRKKKKTNAEIKKIREDYEMLANNHSDLTTNLQELAKKIQKTHSNETQKKRPKYDKSSLDQKDRDQYMNHILGYMEKEKPYLDFDINQSNLANKLNIQSHHFSEVLSFCFEQNFNNFINIYRVNEAKKIMQNPKYDHYKIIAIGYEAGFKSKTSFNRVFKAYVGLTPSEYKKEIASSISES